jgi:hypothetical protein
MTGREKRWWWRWRPPSSSRRPIPRSLSTSAATTTATTLRYAEDMDNRRYKLNLKWHSPPRVETQLRIRMPRMGDTRTTLLCGMLRRWLRVNKVDRRHSSRNHLIDGDFSIVIASLSYGTRLAWSALVRRFWLDSREEKKGRTWPDAGSG